ncbi:MAG: AI-2E family transporter [Bacteroidales bacterium]|nr:AI-2E family transporter [Bacteroidales bacterium]
MKNSKYLVVIIAIIILGALIWYFSTLVYYILFAIVLSFIGQPLTTTFGKIKIRNKSLPRSISAMLALILICFVLVILISVFVPVIVNQASAFANIDINKLSLYIDDFIKPIEQNLRWYNIIGNNDSIINIISVKIINLLKVVDYSLIINYLFSFTGNVVISVFAVLFISFFILKDEHLIFKAIMLATPQRYNEEMNNILSNSKKLLTRYFLGLSTDLLLIITFYTLGLSILGIKNALLIAFVGGIFHIIPYIGPLIGATLGIVLGMAGAISGNMYPELLPIIFKILGVFISVNLIDNFIFQPFIYSNSVKAHPLEIFFVVLIGERVAGIPGMILAIPFYTLIRIVAKEFFNRLKIVQKLTENL